MDPGSENKWLHISDEKMQNLMVINIKNILKGAADNQNLSIL
jgi:hypothetical protein